MARSLEVYELDEWESVSSIDTDRSKPTPSPRTSINFKPMDRTATLGASAHSPRTSVNKSIDMYHTMEYESSDSPDMSESVRSLSDSSAQEIVLNDIESFTSVNDSYSEYSSDKEYSEDFESLVNTQSVQRSDSIIYSDDFECDTETTGNYSDTFYNSSKADASHLSTSSSFQNTENLAFTPRSMLDRTLSDDGGHNLRTSRSDQWLSVTSSRRLSTDPSTWSRHSYITYSDSFDSSTDESSSIQSMESVIASARYKDSSFTTEEKQDKDPKEVAELKAFIAQKLRNLKQLKNGPFVSKELTQSEATPQKINKRTQYFIKKKLNIMKSKQLDEIHRQKQESKSISLQDQKRLKETTEFYGISKATVEKLKIKNIMNKMQLAVDENIHEPKKCNKCKEQKEFLQEKHLIQRMKAKAMDKLIQQRLEQDLYTKGTSNTIAQLMDSLPKLDMDREVVYRKLLSRANDNHSEALEQGHTETLIEKHKLDLEFTGEKNQLFWLEYFKPLKHLKHDNCNELGTKCWMCQGN